MGLEPNPIQFFSASATSVHPLGNGTNDTLLSGGLHNFCPTTWCSASPTSYTRAGKLGRIRSSEWMERLALDPPATVCCVMFLILFLSNRCLWVQQVSQDTTASTSGGTHNTGWEKTWATASSTLRLNYRFFSFLPWSALPLLYQIQSNRGLRETRIESVCKTL